MIWSFANWIQEDIGLSNCLLCVYVYAFKVHLKLHWFKIHIYTKFSRYKTMFVECVFCSYYAFEQSTLINHFCISSFSISHRDCSSIFHAIDNCLVFFHLRWRIAILISCFLPSNSFFHYDFLFILQHRMGEINNAVMKWNYLFTIIETFNAASTNLFAAFNQLTSINNRKD